MIGDNGPRRTNVVASRQPIIDGLKTATATRSALLTSRAALVFDWPPISVSSTASSRSAVEPELADRPGLFLFDTHPEIVELPEIAILEEVRCPCRCDKYTLLCCYY